ncbi:MAG: hypothetical protein M1835_007899 [Candelina submexicana]|nr:MAG: hypothetical protein M1835_007899 [Candelina submexicana]
MAYTFIPTVPYPTMYESPSQPGAGVSDVQWALLQAEVQRLNEALRKATDEVAQLQQNTNVATKQQLETSRRRGYDEGFTKGVEAGIQEERVRARQPPPTPRPHDSPPSTGEPPKQQHQYEYTYYTPQRESDSWYPRYYANLHSNDSRKSSRPWFYDAEPFCYTPSGSSYFDCNANPGVPPKPKAKPKAQAPKATAPKPASKPTAYDILGITVTLSKKQISTAYKKRAFETHPDRHPECLTDPIAKRRWETEFRLVREAYNSLASRASEP